MRYIITMFAFCICYCSSQGQDYAIVKEIPTVDKIDKDDDVSRILFKVHNGRMYTLRPVNRSKKHYDLKLSLFDLESGSMLQCDTISGLPSDLTIYDFDFNERCMIITSIAKYIYFELHNIASTIVTYPTEANRNPAFKKTVQIMLSIK